MGKRCDLPNPSHGFRSQLPQQAPSGTLAGNALSLAAGRATLPEVLTDDAHRRMSTLASRLAERLQDIIAARGLISY